MTLEQIVNNSLVESMKKGDKVRTETLRSIKKSIIEFKTSGIKREMNKEDELKILNHAAKQRKDAIAMYKKANRMEAADNEEKELKIIQEFLPRQMSETEITEIIKSIIKTTGAKDIKDFSKVIGIVMKELKGKAEGALVQQIIKSLLS